MQQPIDFSDGSAIRLTIARYYTPSGRCIQRPYESGKDRNYELDLYTRYEHGEFFSRDSIKQNESERYNTSLGRTVYGGGGIMPDIFVPQDTTGVTSYLSTVINRGLTIQFTFQYTDNNRKKLSQYETEEELLNYLRHQGLVEQFVRFADSKGVKRDIIVFGMPTNFHYGNGMGTNPIQMMQALSAQVIRHRRIMSERCVFIVSSICDGYFHDERWPYLRELYDLFQHDYMNILPDMNRYGEYFATKEEYIRKYRFANAFHPFHGFSMMSCGHLAEEHTSAIYIVGAREPGIARGMGLKTRATFEEALADAMRKYTGPNPNILALPRTFTTAAVHLCMKDGDLRGV